ncbi:uncharacterized protein C8Q71DRAFT_430834 [Rhodofomes roseus]|uniref:Uncharacterized protein n=1 Tax=Rhodofomes roseus TaxID=34475 RepID=A0ABQ8KQM1_9APHY|nr:uncharacterized protein C8Q71DRAFT_430834 [Rhodofomes roseus]KAH9840919.1 hypothetical protein C8Q71DRAFT_430834 [Rhodofomes roseus]
MSPHGRLRRPPPQPMLHLITLTYHDDGRLARVATGLDRARTESGDGITQTGRREDARDKLQPHPSHVRAVNAPRLDSPPRRFRRRAGWGTSARPPGKCALHLDGKCVRFIGIEHYRGIVVSRSEWRANGRTEVTESHTLVILAKIVNDPAHAPSAVGIPVENSADETMLINVLEEAVHRKVEELNWKKVLLHGVGGWAGRYSTPGKKFDGGFFLLRLVTSVLFLHSYVPNLSPTSISILLRAYFSTSLALYIARGRPALRIRNFYASAANPPARARPRAHTTQRRALRGADDERMVPDPAAHTRAQRRLPREAPAFPSALRQPLRRDAGGSR